MSLGDMLTAQLPLQQPIKSQSTCFDRTDAYEDCRHDLGRDWLWPTH
jgi:hypothetical protein